MYIKLFLCLNNVNYMTLIIKYLAVVGHLLIISAIYKYNMEVNERIINPFKICYII